MARHLVCFLMLGVMAACGGDDTTEPEMAGPPAALADLSGSDLAGTVGAPLANPLRVRVTDAEGRPVPGVVVDFRTTAGNGEVGAVPATASRAARFHALAVVDSTDENGEARAVWTLGTVSGEQTVSVLVPGLSTLVVAATAAPGPPASLQFSDASAFVGIVGGVADGPLAGRVADEFGNAIPGVPVTWAAVTAGATVGTTDVTTDSTGVSTTTVTLPNHGLNLFTLTGAGFGPDTIAVIGVEGFEDASGDEGDSGETGFTSHDVRYVGMATFDSTMVMYVRFAQPVVGTRRQATQLASAVSGVLEFDLDQDTTTGLWPVRRCIPGGDSLGFGEDAFIDLDARSLTDSTLFNQGEIAVIRIDTIGMDRCSFQNVAFSGVATVPVYRDSTITVFFPTSLFENRVTFDFTSLVWNAQTVTITDIAPDSLPFTFDLSQPPPAGAATLRSGNRGAQYLPAPAIRALETPRPVRRVQPAPGWRRG